MEKLFNSSHIYHISLNQIHVSILPTNNSNGLNQIVIETNSMESNCSCQSTDIQFKMTTFFPLNMTSWDFCTKVMCLFIAWIFIAQCPKHGRHICQHVFDYFGESVFWLPKSFIKCNNYHQGIHQKIGSLLVLITWN